MDLIGNIKYIENRLGERKSSLGKRKATQKNSHPGHVDEKNPQTDAGHSSEKDDIRLGREVDTTA